MTTVGKEEQRHSKDLWKIAQHQVSQDKSKEGDERTLLVVGSKEGGKSSIVLKFLDRDTAPKPTVALEYSFGRRGRGNDAVKDIVHIWELGGGDELASLVDMPITAATLKALSVVIVADLSKPTDLWKTTSTLLDAVRKRITKVMEDLKRRDSKLPAYLMKKARARLPDDHPDKDLVKPMPVPLLIIGSKYDEFVKLESEPRKLICRALRFIAHTNGATLLFTGQDSNLMSKCRAQLANFSFKIPFHMKNAHFEHDTPISIPFGADTLAGIGAPPESSGINARTPADLWKGACERMFVRDESSGEKSAVLDPGLNEEYREAEIDSLYEKKLQELQRLQKQVERRARDNK